MHVNVISSRRFVPKQTRMKELCKGRRLGGHKLGFLCRPLFPLWLVIQHPEFQQRKALCVSGCHPAVKQSLSSEPWHHNLSGSLTRRRHGQKDLGEEPRPPGLSPGFTPTGWLPFIPLPSFFRPFQAFNAKGGSAAKEKLSLI